MRDGASGIFLAASQFPKNRETRAPLVSEIRPHANELDPKFKYLLDAPEQDPEGRPTVIRFSRKDRSQYVQSEEDGKATGWRAVYQDGRWVAEDGRKSSSAKGSYPCSDMDSDISRFGGVPISVIRPPSKVE